MSYFNIYLTEDQADQPEIEYGYKIKSNYHEVQTIGFCPTCQKRITTPDELYITNFDIFCSQLCSDKFIEMESAV